MTTKYPAGSIICTLDGTTRQGVVIDLDQAPPLASLAITGYMPGGVGPWVKVWQFAAGMPLATQFAVPTASPTSTSVASAFRLSLLRPGLFRLLLDRNSP